MRIWRKILVLQLLATTQLKNIAYAQATENNTSAASESATPAQTTVETPTVEATAPTVTTTSPTDTPSTDLAPLEDSSASATSAGPRVKYPFFMEPVLLGGVGTYSSEGGDGRKLSTGLRTSWGFEVRNTWRRIRSDFTLILQKMNYTSTITNEATQNTWLQFGWVPGYSYPVWADGEHGIEAHIKTPLEKNSYTLADIRTDFAEHSAIFTISPMLGVRWTNPWTNTTIYGGYTLGMGAGAKGPIVETHNTRRWRSIDFHLITKWQSLTWETSQQIPGASWNLRVLLGISKTFTAGML